MAKQGRNFQRLELSGFTLYLSRAQAFGGARYHTTSEWHQASVTRTGASRYSASRTDGGPLIERPDRPGSVSLTPAGRERAGVMEGGSLSFIRLEFSDDFLMDACQLGGSRQGMIPIYNDRAEKFRVLIERMSGLSEIAERPPVIIMEQLAIAAVRELAREARLDFGRHDDAWMHPVALQRVVDRIEAEMHEDLSLALLAQDAGLSISAFVRAFRGSTGVSPGEYLIRRRIYRASKLLADSSLAIKEIARTCGFATHAHLTNVFRSRMGEPPASYRRLSRCMSRT